MLTHIRVLDTKDVVLYWNWVFVF